MTRTVTGYQSPGGGTGVTTTRWDHSKSHPISSEKHWPRPGEQHRFVYRCSAWATSRPLAPPS